MARNGRYRSSELPTDIPPQSGLSVIHLSILLLIASLVAAYVVSSPETTRLISEEGTLVSFTARVGGFFAMVMLGQAGFSLLGDTVLNIKEKAKGLVLNLIGSLTSCLLIAVGFLSVPFSVYHIYGDVQLLSDSPGKLVVVIAVLLAGMIFTAARLQKRFTKKWDKGKDKSK